MSSNEAELESLYNLINALQLAINNAGAQVSVTTLKSALQTALTTLNPGSGTPEGSDKNVQYNNAGAFGAVSNNATATKKYLQQVSTGTPSFQQVAAADVSGLPSVPAGADTQVQFNDASALGANAGLTFVKGTGTLSATVLKQGAVQVATLTGAESLTNKKLGSLTSNGFVKTSGGDGTLSVDAVSYAPLASPTFGGTATIPTLAVTTTVTLPVTRTTMSGNVTLTTASTTYQFFDCNASDRNVTLPVAAAGMCFVIYNFGSANTITVKDSGGSTVTTVAANNSFHTLIYDGTAWQVF